MRKDWTVDHGAPHVNRRKPFLHTFPGAAYHKNWKASESDVASWRDCTSVDHVLPRTRHGGDEVTNLVAACWPCNLSKGNLTLDELGREKLPIAESEWDGLKD